MLKIFSKKERTNIVLQNQHKTFHFPYLLIASTGQLSIASLIQGAFFEDFTFAFPSSVISKTSPQTAAHVPHPIHLPLFIFTMFEIIKCSLRMFLLYIQSE